MAETKMDALPAKEMSLAEQHCKMADIVLCLGTSLQITPACNLPMRSVRGGGQMVIVNLQQTPKDKKASLVIHGLVDKVMLGVMNLLGLRIPPYVRLDLFQVNLKLFHRNAERKYVKWTLRVASVHGQRAQLPFLSSVEVSFPERPELKPAILHKQPFLLKREMLKSRPVKILLSLHFGDGCGCSCTSIEFTVDFQVSEESFKNDKDVVLQKLRDAAIQDWHCGQLAVIERETLSSPRTETTTYAVVTSIVGNKFSAIAGNGKLSVNCKQNGLLLGSNIKKRRSEVIKRDEISQKQQKVY
ncbi:hypothetical protein Syun_010699 [Stephania yunnanensis]|uniref:protein acetyllysine N-acetyltransferase n=1 Tax=Stephania yunnanensis TaxID=152371 RepID=A0AAP0KHX1_9MAGN